MTTKEIFFFSLPMLLCVELETKEGGSVLEIFFIYKNGGNGGGKKKPRREGTAPRPLPCPGVGRGHGGKKRVPPPAVVGGERGRAGLGWWWSVKSMAGAYFLLLNVWWKFSWLSYPFNSGQQTPPPPIRGKWFASGSLWPHPLSKHGTAPSSANRQRHKPCFSHP